MNTRAPIPITWLRICTAGLPTYGFKNRVPENWVPGNRVPENWVPESWVPENLVHENWVHGNWVPENWVPGNWVPEINGLWGLSKPTNKKQQQQQVTTKKRAITKPSDGAKKNLEVLPRYLFWKKPSGSIPEPNLNASSICLTHVIDHVPQDPCQTKKCT